MTDSKVSKLHQQNKDKETPPLLAYPWFGSQFLSHAFLALERDSNFTQITRLVSVDEKKNFKEKKWKITFKVFQSISI
jgi:hypothetical protein